uniref:F-box domain-containing protein n=1 Tax=Meloidogyne incognita TaxID=6306 RepID=A0A914LBH8_MELIC
MCGKASSTKKTMQPLITLLPNETIEDIFKFVSYKNLCYNIRPTNYLFSQLSAKLIDKLYPREVSLTIKDGTHVTSCVISNAPLLKVESNQFRTFKTPRPVPKGLPPANVKFDDVRNVGQITEFLKFLERIRPSIEAYNLEITSFGKFNKYLNSAWISLDALFLKLPTRCLHISVECKDAFLSYQFFSCPFVARCSSLRIRSAFQGFDNIALANWLLNLTSKRKLVIDGFYNDQKEPSDFVGNVKMLLSTLKEEIIKNPNLAPRFEIIASNIGVDFPIEEFCVEGKIHHSNDLGRGITTFGHGGIQILGRFLNRSSFKLICGNYVAKKCSENVEYQLVEPEDDSNAEVKNIFTTNITFA